MFLLGLFLFSICSSYLVNMPNFQRFGYKRCKYFVIHNWEINSFHWGSTFAAFPRLKLDSVFVFCYCIIQFELWRNENVRNLFYRSWSILQIMVHLTRWPHCWTKHYYMIKTFLFADFAWKTNLVLSGWNFFFPNKNNCSDHLIIVRMWKGKYSRVTNYRDRKILLTCGEYWPNKSMLDCQCGSNTWWGGYRQGVVPQLLISIWQSLNLTLQNDRLVISLEFFVTKQTV